MSDQEPLPTVVNPEPEPMPTVADLAYATNTHRVTIYRRIHDGKIDARRIGGVYRIPWREYRRLTGTDTAA